MRQDNPFAPVPVVNDLEGLIIPWSLYGTLEKELMEQRYLKLTNNSYGYIIRYPVR